MCFVFAAACDYQKYFNGYKSYVEQNRAHNYVWTTWCCHFNKFREAIQSLHDYLEFAQATTTPTNSVTSQKCIAAVECTCTCIRVNKSHS